MLIYFKREKSVYVILQKILLALVRAGTFVNQFVSELDMMLGTTKLCTLISVLTTLTFTQGHGVMGKLELVQSFCCKVA